LTTDDRRRLLRSTPANGVPMHARSERVFY